MNDDDWQNDEADEDDYDQQSSDDADDCYVCPSCSAAVYEDAEQCPRCGDYITPQSASLFSRSSPWFVGAVLLTLAAVLLSALVWQIF